MRPSEIMPGGGLILMHGHCDHQLRPHRDHRRHRDHCDHLDHRRHRDHDYDHQRQCQAAD